MAATGRRRTMAAAAVAVAAAGYVMALWSATNRHPVIADTIGYATAGRRIAGGQGLGWWDQLNAQIGPWFSPFTWMVEGNDGEMIYGNPVGYPALLAAVKVATGSDTAMDAVGPLAALVLAGAAAWLAWLVTRRRLAAVVAGAMVALAPAVVRFSTDSWSDVPVAAALTLGVALFLGAGEGPRRPGLAQAAAGGALVGWAIVARAPSAVVLLPLLAAEVAAARSGRPRWRTRLPFYVLAGAGGLALLAAQQVVFDAPLASKYEAEFGWYPHPPFSPRYAVSGSFAGGASMPALVGTLVTNAPLATVLAVAGWRVARTSKRGVLVGCGVALLLPYAVYAFPTEGVNARFMLPALPILAVLGAAGLAGLVDRLPARLRTDRRATAVAAVVGVAVSAAAIVVPAIGAVADAADRRDEGRQRVAAARAVAGAVPVDAVLLAHTSNDLLAIHGGRSTFNYRRLPPSDRVQERYRHELVEPCLTAALHRILASGRPVYFVGDTESPPWQAEAVVTRNFRTEPVDAAIPLRRVVAPLGPAPACSLLR